MPFGLNGGAKEADLRRKGGRSAIPFGLNGDAVRAKRQNRDGRNLSKKSITST